MYVFVIYVNVYKFYINETMKYVTFWVHPLSVYVKFVGFIQMVSFSCQSLKIATYYPIVLMATVYSSILPWIYIWLYSVWGYDK